MKQFKEALDSYELAARAAAQAEESYRLAHAKALLASDGKNEAARKADADAATTELRSARNEAALKRDVALHMVQYLKAQAGGGAA